MDASVIGNELRPIFPQRDLHQSRKSFLFDHLKPFNRLGSLSYCWWLKSCTTWDVWNPIKQWDFNYLPTYLNWCETAGFRKHRSSRSFHMSVSKNRGKTPKTDGENHGKTLLFNGWFGGKTHHFRKPSNCSFWVLDTSINGLINL